MATQSIEDRLLDLVRTLATVDDPDDPCLEDFSTEDWLNAHRQRIKACCELLAEVDHPHTTIATKPLRGKK